MKSPVRILIVSSHPVQYAVPVYRALESDPRVELTVAFCTMASAEKTFDQDFGVEVAWGIPMLEGYRHREMRNRAWHPRSNEMFGMVNTEVWGLVRSGDYDVVLLPGYRGLTFWIALVAAKLSRIPFAWGTDAYSITTHLTPAWLRTVKGIIVPRIYGLADMVLCMSSRGEKFLRSLRMKKPLIHLVPAVVDNEFFASAAAKVNPALVRKGWGVRPDDLVVLCCGKLVPWKRPEDVVEAVALVPGAVAVFAGDGELLAKLEARAAELGVRDRVHFLGFTNQLELAAVYAASDVLVLPSSYDTFGVVVNEAMACGLPAIVTDAAGCGDDLIVSGETGWVYPVGDRLALAAHLEELTDPEVLREMGEKARAHIDTWSIREHVDAFVGACQEVVRDRGQGPA